MEIRVNIIEFVVIYSSDSEERVRCHFVFAGPVQLVCCDACSTWAVTVKPCTAYFSPLTRYRDRLRCALALPVLNMCHSA